MNYERFTHTVFQALVIQMLFVSAIVSSSKAGIGETSISPQLSEPQIFQSQLRSLIGKQCRACQTGKILRYSIQPGQYCFHIMKCKHGHEVRQCMGNKPVAQPHCNNCFVNRPIVGHCTMAKEDGTHPTVLECPPGCPNT
ncbi:hypothetical protein PGT21_014382 [Puccinia graminis f. sp. tritici]|uniref:Secreted protein n=1 Tax=Puccinia graminis f. sp. tritici TaxID=56615 RepID=A0A5B0QI37_PUCGR|nr:hypothetical protein PGT21_014382 [Puccinia graminis f. sp. tritici]